MRLALLMPVLICIAAPAHAEGARESRYGPTTPRQTNATAAVRYDGPMLGWANKRQAPLPVAASAPATPERPAPIASWAAYQPTSAPAAYAPPPPTVLAPASSLPTSLYAAPRPAPVAAAAATSASPAKDWSSYRSPRVSGPAPTAAPAQVAAAGGVTGARYYSVDRDYGLTPDAVPPAGPDNRVLITAAEPPADSKDAAPVHGSADWLAAGVAGDDDQDGDSASRRAKTRNETL